jgi:hypothetical protein
MEHFNLPPSTTVNKSIPKNAFDYYTNWKQKKQFTDLVAKITWTNKLSTETINLPGNEVSEIQFITVALKTKTIIAPLLKIIDKAIPYHILFTIFFEDEYYHSAAQKHPNPLDNDNMVIDWVYASNWKPTSSQSISFTLKQSLDHIFFQICNQLAPKLIRNKTANFNQLLADVAMLDKLQREIAQLKNQIKTEKQFNKKVEMNIRLNQLFDVLKEISRYT